jgi:hypothetical protein
MDIHKSLPLLFQQPIKMPAQLSFKSCWAKPLIAMLLAYGDFRFSRFSIKAF